MVAPTRRPCATSIDRSGSTHRASVERGSGLTVRRVPGDASTAQTSTTSARAAKLLATVPWSWDLTSLTEAVSSIGGEEVGRVAPAGTGRITFRVDDFDVDVYFDSGLVVQAEVNTAVFADSDLLSTREYEDKVDEYFALFSAAVAATEAELGTPAFCDGAAADGFPDDQDAEWVALWPMENGRLMIEQRHEDRELPVRICVVVAPPAVQ
jgi:hypothetical protein